MTFKLIGLGLMPPGDITLRGKKAIDDADTVYLEEYTNCPQTTIEEIEEAIEKPIEVLPRKAIEESDKLLKEASKKNIVLLVFGNPLFATTHQELVSKGAEVIHNASIMDAVLDTGLQAYKFGRIVSLPHGPLPKSVHDYIHANQRISLHTLVLLDVKRDGKTYMTGAEAIEVLSPLKLDKIVVCSKLGSPQAKISYGKPKDLLKKELGKPPFCLVIPGELHFLEEEALEKFC